MLFWVILVLAINLFPAIISLGPIIKREMAVGKGDDITVFLQALAWPYFLPRAVIWAKRRKHVGK